MVSGRLDGGRVRRRARPAVAERHAAHAVTVDADHLADELTAIAAHPDTGTDRELQSFDVEAQADDSGHGPGCLGCDVHAGHVEPVRQSASSIGLRSGAGANVASARMGMGSPGWLDTNPWVR